MASRTLAHVPAVPQTVPAVEKPHTYQEALKQGWTVVSDRSVQSINQKRREGKLTMQKAGSREVLTVDYIGSPKGGFRFSVPQFADPLVSQLRLTFSRRRAAY